VVDNSVRERNLGLLMKHRNQHFMRKIQAVIVSGVALALFGAATLNQPLFAAEAPSQTKAIVRAVHGQGEYFSGGNWVALRPNMELEAGTQIKTGPDSYVSLSVNGLRSAVKITQNTTITLSKMDSMGSGADSDSDTSLKLDSGTVMGQVRKLSANSRYEIETPNGVAGIRGTEFVVSVIPRPDGTFLITYTCTSGTLVASAIVGPSTVVKVLGANQSWTPGQEVVPTPQALIDFYQTEFQELNFVGGTINLGNPPLAVPFNGNGPPQAGNGSTQAGNTSPGP
jgi:hypothetical protein